MDVFTNQEQLRLLLQSVLLGVGTGLLYDVLRALRRHICMRPRATAALDMVFWLVLAAGLFEFGLVFAAGQPRFFVLAGAAGGAALYFLLLSGAVLLILAAVLRAGARAWRWEQKQHNVCKMFCTTWGFQIKSDSLQKKFKFPLPFFAGKV